MVFVLRPQLTVNNIYINLSADYFPNYSFNLENAKILQNKK